jgi:hypothetical protein
VLGGNGRNRHPRGYISVENCRRKDNTFSAYGADSIWRDFDTRHLLGEICKEIYIAIAGDTTNKRYMARNAT